jgi:hypothetical protein
MISDKVRPHHLERKAPLYVRQSSAHQVLHNRLVQGATGVRTIAPAPRCTSTLHRNDLSQVQSIVGLIGRAAPCPRAHAPCTGMCTGTCTGSRAQSLYADVGVHLRSARHCLNGSKVEGAG